MRAIALLALLAVLDVTAASAQTEAPIGHRQPRANNVPDEKNWQNTNPNDPLLKENRELEQKLKGICRGCENEHTQQAKKKKGRRYHHHSA